MWGIIPAAGKGSRIQPLAFSKELLPVGSQFDGQAERPRAVSEYLLERMIRGGATRICIVIAPGKTDIIEYYGSGVGGARICYVVQQSAAGLCDAVFGALPVIPPDEVVLVGLPDTVWFPEEGFRALPDDALSFLLFPVDRPELFDAVATDGRGRVSEICSGCTEWISAAGPPRRSMDSPVGAQRSTTWADSTRSFGRSVRDC